MWTNQPIYFALLVISTVFYLAFGIYPILLIVGLVLFLIVRAKLRGPREWRTPEYAVRARGARDAWVEYEEGGRILALRAEWSGTKASTELLIWLENKVYLPPDYLNALPEERIAEIQQRISKGLTEMKIHPAFVRLGWTSLR